VTAERSLTPAELDQAFRYLKSRKSLMADVVSAKVRSRMMAAIKGKNTQPELVLRHGLHRLGFRYTLHNKSLPGRPDLVFSKYKAVLFAHGCFWHQHDCHLFKWPKSRKNFWRKKLLGNRALDEVQVKKLAAEGWRVGIVWECATKGPGKQPVRRVILKCADWLRSSRRRLEIKGRL
jgi:DNA mismatch endonuclease (patch repair protein)